MKLIPLLRFPEFEGDDLWIERELNKVGEIVTGNTPSTKEPFFYGGDYLFVSPADIGDDMYIKSTKTTLTELGYSKARKIKAGSVLFVCIGSTIGKVAINKFDCATNQQINSVIPNPKHSGGFLYSILKHNASKISEIAGNQAVPIINKSLFSSILIQLPPTLQEQQKIADCLSSLDSLIAAHRDKLDALRAHKKGLMQNLFPQEGERVPRFRFEGFEGEWEETTLGELGDPLMCKRIFKDQTTSNPEKGIPFYKIGTFGKEADAYISPKLYEEFKSKYNFPNKGDILISASGTIGRLVIYDGAPAYFQDSNIIWLGHDESKVTNALLFYIYSTIKWQTSDGGVIKRLYNSDLKRISITYPVNPSEQQKIADCLSSVDELIAAQEERIDQLQEHKRGLMQGLFPKID